MAFTADQVMAQLDANAGTSTGRQFEIPRFVDNGNGATDMWVIGITAPYAGRPGRWVQVAQSNTAAQAAALIQAAFA